MPRKPAAKTSKKHLTDKQFQALIENAHDGIILYDNSGKIKYSSESVLKITGYRENEILGKSGRRFIHPDDVDAAANAFRRVRKKAGNSTTILQRIRHRNGHYFWSESRLTNFSHVDELDGIVSNFRDVTDRKIAQEKAHKSQELLEILTRNLTEGIFMGILGKELTYVNEAFLQQTGYSSFQQLQKINSDTILSSVNSKIKLSSQLKRRHELKRQEVTLRKKDGGHFVAEMNVSRIRQAGKEHYFAGTIRDITREREAIAQHIESQNFLNNIINTVAAPIFVKDHLHRWIMFNDQFCELLGRKRKEILGKRDEDFLPKEEVAHFYRVDNQVLKAGRTITNEEQLTRNGTRHHLLTVKSRYVNEKGEKFVIGFITDITYLKKAEEEVKHLHANLVGILESSDESIFSIDKNLCYTAFNKRHKQIMKSLYGADIRLGGNKFKYLKHTSDRKWLKAELIKALDDNHFVTEHFQESEAYTGFIQITYNPIYDEGGEVKGVAVFVQNITHRKRYEQIINTINANLRAVMESTTDGIIAFDRNLRCIMYNNSFAKGIKKAYGSAVAVGDELSKVLPPTSAKVVKSYITRTFKGDRVSVEQSFKSQKFEIFFNPISDEKGKVIGAAMFIRNITERTKMEESVKTLNQNLTGQNMQLAAQERDLKSALDELSERNFELDQLVYKTSHDLRSPLSSIMGLINLASIDRDPASIQLYLNKIEGRVKKLDEFICSMLNYARVNRVDVMAEPIDLKGLVKSCIQELEYLENFQKVKIQITSNKRIATCSLDKLRLKIIFSNIISNAYKYFNPETESYLKLHIQIRRKDIQLNFEDNGIGIKEEHKAKIFNMFYRATDRSQGSGLGMYIVKQAVEKMNGHIRLDSVYGFGTTIQITLPIQ